MANGFGVVDGIDYNILVRNFGKGNINSIQQTQPAPTAVPTVISTPKPTYTDSQYED